MMFRSLLHHAASISNAILGLFQAEIDRLAADLTRVRKDYVRIGLIFVLAFAFVFWSVGALVFAAVAGLATRLTYWGAATIVGVGLLLVALLLTLVARSLLRRTETPARAVRRRIDDHLTFWREELGSTERDAPASASPGASASGGERIAWSGRQPEGEAAAQGRREQADRRQRPDVEDWPDDSDSR